MVRAVLKRDQLPHEAGCDAEIIQPDDPRYDELLADAVRDDDLNGTTAGRRRSGGRVGSRRAVRSAVPPDLQCPVGGDDDAAGDGPIRLGDAGDVHSGCSLRAAPTDRILTDEEWAEIAEELVHQTGFAPRGDPSGCRWIAVRHADDHIHVVVTLARDDGRNPDVKGDYWRVRSAYRTVEKRYGLRSTAPADRTAAPRPTRGEIEQAQRKGWSEPPRTTLRREVRTAAAAAESEGDFFARLDEAGLIVRKRFSVRNPGQVTGYSVALPGHTNPDGDPVLFSGGKLAPDLTLPKLRHRWQSGPSAGSSGRTRFSRSAIRGSVRLSAEERTAAYRDAARSVGRAAQLMRWIDDPAARADLAAATSDALHVAAAMTGNHHLRLAADSYDRAAREPYGKQPAPTPYGIGFRIAIRALAIVAIFMSDHSKQHRDPVAETMKLVINLVYLLEAAAELREAQYRSAQADAARKAAAYVRNAQRQGIGGSAELSSTALRRITASPTPTALAAADFPIPIEQALRPNSTPTAPTDPRPQRHPDGPLRSRGPRG